VTYTGHQYLAIMLVELDHFPKELGKQFQQSIYGIYLPIFAVFSDVVLNSFLSRVKAIIIIHLHPQLLDSGKCFLYSAMLGGCS